MLWYGYTKPAYWTKIQTQSEFTAVLFYLKMGMVASISPVIKQKRRRQILTPPHIIGMCCTSCFHLPLLGVIFRELPITAAKGDEVRIQNFEIPCEPANFPWSKLGNLRYFWNEYLPQQFTTKAMAFNDFPLIQGNVGG